MLFFSAISIIYNSTLTSWSCLVTFKTNKFQTSGSIMESPHVFWTRSLPQSPSGLSSSLELLSFSSTENMRPQSVSYSKHLQKRQGKGSLITGLIISHSNDLSFHLILSWVGSIGTIHQKLKKGIRQLRSYWSLIYINIGSGNFSVNRRTRVLFRLQVFSHLFLVLLAVLIIILRNAFFRCETNSICHDL